MKRGYRLRDGRQVPTRPATIHEVMSQPRFALGVADARIGRPVHRDYDVWHVNGQWAYERGRMWAVLTPRHVPLKRNRRINPDAMAWFLRHGNDII